MPHEEQRYLVDEIEKMVGMMESGETLVQAVEIMYPKKKINREHPLEVLALFIKGLKENEFFDYVQFIKAVRGRRKSSN